MHLGFCGALAPVSKAVTPILPRADQHTQCAESGVAIVNDFIVPVATVAISFVSWVAKLMLVMQLY